MSFSTDPIESASKGGAKAILEWSEEKLDLLIKKLKDKDIAFIQDDETIKLAKEQREKGEWHFFKNYVKNRDFRILFQMGLTLRALETEGKDFDLLTKKIVKKYDVKGLHIAHFVQNGLFSKYIGNVLESASSSEELTFEIEYIFNNIDNVATFIRATDKPKQKIGEIVTKIQAHSPRTFIISSVGGAMSNCEKVKNGVIQKISSEYTCELYESEQKSRKIYFLNRTEYEDIS